ncbi:MAG: 30S ribosomal protein S3 [candidate division WOR-3 bacterium]
MGQKVHPYGFRLGIYKDWKAHWFSDRKKEYVKYLEEDIKIRQYLRERYKDARVSDIIIDRAGEQITVTIHTASPGMVIGQKGKEIELVKKELSALLKNENITIHVQEIRVPELDAQLVAEGIARRIEQQVSHRRAMKRAVSQAFRMGAKGIKVQCKGRIQGAEIARKEGYMQGRVPLQTIRADIDYGFATAFTRYGTIGVKVWIYKGEILEKPELEEV